MPRSVRIAVLDPAAAARLFRPSCQDERMTVVIDEIARIELGQVGAVVANNSARSSFAVSAGTELLALDQNLQIGGRWPAGPVGRGWHACSSDRGLALISGLDEVRLVDHAGMIRWRYPHPPWSGAFESGCTWFDATGQPWAVVPDDGYGQCLVLCLDADSGRLLAMAPIAAAPAGISPVHHGDGWVGLSEGEGQDAARAWWVRSGIDPAGGSIEVIDASWRDWVLTDVDPSGTKILTTPHGNGPLLVRSFPGTSVLRSVEPPGRAFWDFTACFAGELIIAKLISDGQERLVAVDSADNIHEISAEENGWLIPASEGTWLAATGTTIRRCRARTSC